MCNVSAVCALEWLLPCLWLHHISLWTCVFPANYSHVCVWMNCASVHEFVHVHPTDYSIVCVPACVCGPACKSKSVSCEAIPPVWHTPRAKQHNLSSWQTKPIALIHSHCRSLTLSLSSVHPHSTSRSSKHQFCIAKPQITDAVVHFRVGFRCDVTTGLDLSEHFASIDEDVMR